MRAIMFYATHKDVLAKMEKKELDILIKFIETMP